KKKWRRQVADVVARFIAALEPDDTVIGGGNVKKLNALPPGSRAGDNDNAFAGGFRLWEHARPDGGGRAKPWTWGRGTWLLDLRYRARNRRLNRRHGGRSKITTRQCAAAICETCSRMIPNAASG